MPQPRIESGKVGKWESENDVMHWFSLTFPLSHLPTFFAGVLASLLLAGCHSNKQTPAQRADAARALFEQTTKNFHVPSAEAMGDEKLKLQGQAAAGYGELLKKY